MFTRWRFSFVFRIVALEKLEYSCLASRSFSFKRSIWQVNPGSQFLKTACPKLREASGYSVGIHGHAPSIIPTPRLSLRCQAAGGRGRERRTDGVMHGNVERFTYGYVDVEKIRLIHPQELVAHNKYLPYQLSAVNFHYYFKLGTNYKS